MLNAKVNGMHTLLYSTSPMISESQYTFQVSLELIVLVRWPLLSDRNNDSNVTLTLLLRDVDEYILLECFFVEGVPGLGAVGSVTRTV